MINEDYEEFTEKEIEILQKYVTNTKSHIFALRNLPEVIKGALFSRYSRSSLGLRSLLLKEFISSGSASAFLEIVGRPDNVENQSLAIKKAQDFYDRILDGYGDDSIGELGGAHLAVENVSMLAAKFIEDARIGGSPLEKSTRYIYFDQKVNGEYLFYREPILMASAFRDLYISTCNHLFETYSKLIPPLTKIFEEQMPYDPKTPKGAYTAALRAKVLDCLRGLLPAATLTNMGMYGNGRFYEGLIHKLHCSTISEMRDIGTRMCEELTKVIPSFVRRSNTEHHTHERFASFFEALKKELGRVADELVMVDVPSDEPSVRLITSDPDAVAKVAAALLFPYKNCSLEELQKKCSTLNDEEIARILDAGSSARESRRHKSPRGLEHALFTFQIMADFGIYRDLHRHRMLTQERQKLSTSYGYWTPDEILNTQLEKEYRDAMEKARLAFDQISLEFPEEAEYVVPMAYNVRWYFTVNLRALQWMCELRSQAAGHPSYRRVAQEMARQVIEAYPQFERFFKFVDFSGYQMGRFGQEVRKAQRSGEIS